MADDVIFMVPGQDRSDDDAFERKKPDGAWVIMRDANLLTPETKP